METRPTKMEEAEKPSLSGRGAEEGARGPGEEREGLEWEVVITGISLEYITQQVR